MAGVRYNHQEICDLTSQKQEFPHHFCSFSEARLKEQKASVRLTLTGKLLHSGNVCAASE